MLLVLCIALLAETTVSATPRPRVAIVGGGISGAATATFLLELVPQALIDVYEADSRVGGRAYTLDANLLNVPIDAGATDIFSQNEYLVSFVKRFGLAKAHDQGGKDIIGLWDGDGFRFRWPDSALLPAHIVARYGLSPLHLVSAVKKAVSKLTRIYELQAHNQSFASPQALFDALGLLDLTQNSAASYFEGTLGVEPKFVDEFVDGASRDNYNQDKAINAFVDLVSLAGAGIGGSIFSLENGTTGIVEALLRSSPRITTHRSARVTSIAPTATYTRESGGGAFMVGVAGRPVTAYDAVALATPLETARGLSLEQAARINASRPYQRTCVTFVSGRIRAAYFGLAPDDDVPTSVLTVQNASLPFSTLAAHATLPNGTRVYKMFSKRPLDDTLLSTIFEERHRTLRIDWPAAYPKLLPTPPQTWPPFEIPLGSGSKAPKLVYVAAMESAVSCMETQVIAAKNAALRMARALSDVMC